MTTTGGGNINTTESMTKRMADKIANKIANKLTKTTRPGARRAIPLGTIVTLCNDRNGEEYTILGEVKYVGNGEFTLLHSSTVGNLYTKEEFRSTGRFDPDFLTKLTEFNLLHPGALK